MKATKRLLLLLLGVIFALALAACDDGEENPAPAETPAGYTVTLTYDAQKGDASLSAPASGQKYAAGESVTLTVSPKSGYVTEGVTVDGAAVSLAEGKYSFSVQHDTAVNVTFGEEPTEDPPEEVFDVAAALEEISGKITFDGAYSCTFTDPSYDYTCASVTSFGEDAIWVYEEDTSSGEILCDYIAVNHGGKLALVYHDADNKIAYLDQEDSFESAYNPFAGLMESDFIALEGGVYRMADPEKAAAVSLAITGVGEDVTVVQLVAEDGAFTQLRIEMEDTLYNATDELYYDSVYEYYLTDVGTGSVPEGYADPYETVPEHAALVSALQAAAQAKNYKVNRTEQYLFDTYQYDIYVTESAIYSEGTNAGFVLKNGAAYNFSYDPAAEEAILAGTVECTFEELLASFSGFAPELFAYDKGAYVYRPDFYIYGLTSGVAGECASALVAGADELAAYAVELEIVLDDDGVLKQVAFTFEANGDIGSIILDFSGFGTTELPIDLSNAKTPFEAFEGSYTGRDLIENEDGSCSYVDYALTVTSTQFLFTIDGEEAAVEDLYIDTALGYLVITFLIGEKGYIILSNEGPNGCGLMLMTAEYDLQVLLLPEGSEGPEVPTPYPFIYYGTYESVPLEEGEDSIKIEIGEEIVITKNGDPVTITGDIYYTGVDGISIVYEGESYFIIADKYAIEDNTVQQISLHNNSDSVHFYLERTGAGVEPERPFEMPKEYVEVGTYSGKQGGVTYYVTFTAEKLSVKIGSADFVDAVILDYDASRNFHITLDGVPYTIMNMSDGAKDATELWLTGDGDLTVVLTPFSGEIGEEPATEISPNFYGNFKGTANGTVYELHIAENGFELKIGEAEFAVGTAIRKTNDTDYYFTVDGKEYNVYNVTESGTVTYVYMMATGLAPVKLDKQTEAGDPLDIAATFLGKYEGTISGQSYVVEITETSITVTIDGTAATCEFVSCEKGGSPYLPYYVLKVKINGTEYSINSDTVSSEDTPTPFLEFVESSYAKIYRVDE